MPSEFSSPEHYTSVFEPLLLEEARESVRREFQEAAAAGGWQGGRVGCRAAAAGRAPPMAELHWLDCRVACCIACSATAAELQGPVPARLGAAGKEWPVSVQELRADARAGWYRLHLRPLHHHGEVLRDRAVVVLSLQQQLQQHHHCQSAQGDAAGHQGGRGRPPGHGLGSRGLRQAAALNSSRPLQVQSAEAAEQQQRARQQKLALRGCDAGALDDGSSSDATTASSAATAGAAAAASAGPSAGASSAGTAGASSAAGAAAGAAAAAADDGSVSSNEAVHLTAIVAEPCAGPRGTLVVDIHPWCGSHQGAEGAPCSRALALLGDARCSWLLTCTSGNLLVTHQRELEALYRWGAGVGVCWWRQRWGLLLRRQPSRSPRRRAPAREEGPPSVLPSPRHPATPPPRHLAPAAATRRARHVPLLKHILSPSTQLAVPQGQLASVWPSDVDAKQYVEHLVSAFDLPQRHAIQLCATHLAQPAQVAAACPGRRQLPVTLIQGPPGTGKTHTVLGILNTWHLIQFQRYYEALMQLMKAEAFRQGRDDGPAARHQELCSIDELEPLLERLLLAVPSKAQRPRILVCAPSNAATDELLERILRDGFRDRRAGLYRPHVLRVGAEEAVSEEAKRVWLEMQVGALGAGGAGRPHLAAAAGLPLPAAGARPAANSALRCRRPPRPSPAAAPSAALLTHTLTLAAPRAGGVLRGDGGRRVPRAQRRQRRGLERAAVHVPRAAAPAAPRAPAGAAGAARGAARPGRRPAAAGQQQPGGGAGGQAGRHV